MVDISRYDAAFLSIDEVVGLIRRALQEGRPFALARMGTAEIAVLAHELDPAHWPMQPFIAYSGVSRFLPHTALWLQAVLQLTDLLGLLPLGHSQGPQTLRLLQTYGIKPRQVCNAFLPKDLAVYPPFIEMLAGPRLIVVGRRAAESVPALARHGIRPVATYDLEGMDSLVSTLDAIAAGPDFDLALLAAGVPATIAAVELAEKRGKVALDFGHGLDILIDGDAFDYPKLESTWWQQHQTQVQPGVRSAPAVHRAGRPPRTATARRRRQPPGRRRLKAQARKRRS